MTGPIGPGTTDDDRRRVERRASPRVSDLTLPEFRRIVLTSTLFVAVLLLFAWMVRTVIIAAILAVIVGVYLRPFYNRLLARVRNPALAALIALIAVVVPLLAILIYSYIEIRGAADYLAANQGEVVQRIDAALRRIPFLAGATFTDQVRDAVVAASNYGSELVGELREALVTLSVSTAVFFFTTFYILTDAETISAYVRGKIPPRYAELVATLETNVRGVLYGAIYATLVTQTIKSVVILLMNLAFDVPLAAVLAILSFVIGFFPIVGSWSVYVPVAAWLVIFRDNWFGAVVMLLVGFVGNTMLISMYLRPKLAAEKSRVLNFYWMFVGLVTGVYTFGIVGILLGPVIIGLLKAVVDTVTAQQSWRLLDAEGDPASPVSPLIR
ncbi:MAG TPA: AI-2E family transporter [Gemmatimonadaceae bacterium]|nr:AI-2E family transporter [Gemmatimonadaceae bacterium]